MRYANLRAIVPFMSSIIDEKTAVFDSANQPTEWQKWQELFQYGYLFRNLVVRDLKVRYKNSLLGIMWSFLNPLLMMLVYTALFTILIPNDDIHSYPVFILVALLPWNFFSASLLSGTTSLTSNGHLLKKVYFPRILLPLTSLASNFVNYLLSLVILIIFLFLFRIGITVYALWVPVILAIQIIFTIGLILLLCSLHAYYRDVLMVLQVGILAWFFLTPVFYPFERIQQQAELAGYTFNAARLMRWVNPMASIVDGYRTVLWGNVGSPTPGNMDLFAILRMLVTALLMFFIGLAVFRKTERSIVERL